MKLTELKVHHFVQFLSKMEQFVDVSWIVIADGKASYDFPFGGYVLDLWSGELFFDPAHSDKTLSYRLAYEAYKYLENVGYDLPKYSLIKR